jgi:hypothetical protein
MFNRPFFRIGLASLAVLGSCFPTSVSPAAGVSPTTGTEAAASKTVALMSDIALAPGGLLVGQVLDEKMQPVSGAKIAIQSDGRTAASTVTDADGVFAVAGLRGGVHQVVTDKGSQNCRFWAPGTAPPRAVANLRFVPGQDHVVRGQWGPPSSSWKDLATNPWVITGFVATAIAVPVVLHNIDDDDDRS